MAASDYCGLFLTGFVNLSSSQNKTIKSMGSSHSMQDADSWLYLIGFFFHRLIGEKVRVLLLIAATSSLFFCLSVCFWACRCLFVSRFQLLLTPSYSQSRSLYVYPNPSLSNCVHSLIKVTKFTTLALPTFISIIGCD